MHISGKYDTYKYFEIAIKIQSFSKVLAHRLVVLHRPLTFGLLNTSNIKKWRINQNQHKKVKNYRVIKRMGLLIVNPVCLFWWTSEVVNTILQNIQLSNSLLWVQFKALEIFFFLFYIPLGLRGEEEGEALADWPNLQQGSCLPGCGEGQTRYQRPHPHISVRNIAVRIKTDQNMCRLTVEEQEKVIMEEYELGWADRAERVQFENINLAKAYFNCKKYSFLTK